MLCENTFCVYYFKGRCLKNEEITLNNKGNPTNASLVRGRCQR